MNRIIGFTTIFAWLLLLFSCGVNREKADQSASKTDLEYLIKGEEIVKISQAELMQNVSAAIQEGGPAYAVEFCNLRAMGLVDSLSGLYDCKIQRIALRYRNPLDKPGNDAETSQLRRYQRAIENGDKVEPVLRHSGDQVEYYQAIVINNGACLLCHGDPGAQIADETLKKIRELYPQDLATGFAMNDFRGAWKITFNN